MANTTPRAKFSIKHLLMADKFRATIDIRYYLNGVAIIPCKTGGVYIAASDGNTMLIAHDEGGILTGAPQEGVIIAIKPGLMAAARRFARSDDFSVILEDGRLSINSDFGMSQTDSEVFVSPGVALIDAKFPPALKLVPEFKELKPHTACTINPLYLARIAAVNSIGTHLRTTGVKFWTADNYQGKFVVQLFSHPEVIIVIMGLRHSDSDKFPAIIKANTKPSNNSL